MAQRKEGPVPGIRLPCQSGQGEAVLSAEKGHRTDKADRHRGRSGSPHRGGDTLSSHIWKRRPDRGDVGGHYRERPGHHHKRPPERSRGADQKDRPPQAEGLPGDGDVRKEDGDPGGAGGCGEEVG